MDDKLTKMTCSSLEEIKLLNSEEIEKNYSKLNNHWKLSENKLVWDIKLKNFKEVLAFVNVIGAIAEAENHHPDICLSYNKINLTTSTHSKGGLTLCDFILASKIEAGYILLNLPDTE